MLTIKRYPNRKFYNPETSQYVTLGGIASLIRSGREVQVIDHASGEDLTTLILTQIILEQEKRQSGFVPRGLLTGLVQASGLTLNRIRQALSDPVDWQRQVDAEIERRIEGLSEEGGLTAAEAADLKMLLLRSREEASMEIEEEAILRVLAEQDLPTRGELEALNRQLENLLEQVSELGGKSVESLH
jgi:polyhydroxyalkanoate synthesis repressor PhaR